MSVLQVAFCINCGECTLWVNGETVYPPGGTAPKPNPDLPCEIKADYEEARAIASVSPRGSAALLRLAVQKLCKHLGESGENLNKDIAELVKKGLKKDIQQALDYVRVIGNCAVHPGHIDLKDDQTTANTLFLLINLIADSMITQNKGINALYSSLPQSVRDAIAQRDGSK